MPYKNIKLRLETWERLSSLLEPGESFDHLINRLIDRVRELEEKVVELERSIPLEIEKKAREKAAQVVEERVRNGVDSISLDKAAWYVTKLVFSVQSLKDLVQLGYRPDDVARQMKRLGKVLEQIRERYKVETRTLYEIAEQFRLEPTKENLVLLNEATKELIKSILIKMLALEVVR